MVTDKEQAENGPRRMSNPEHRHCNQCGETWQDSGDYFCPFCNSEDTEIVEDE